MDDLPTTSFSRIPEPLDAQLLITVTTGSRGAKRSRGNDGKRLVMIPLDGMTLDVLVRCVNNHEDPWGAIINDDGVAFLRPMTLPTLVRDVRLDEDSWRNEQDQVARVLSGDARVESCVLVVSRESDSSVWTLELPLDTVEDARALAGV